MKSFKTILQSLSDSNYLKAKKIWPDKSYVFVEPLLLKNGEHFKQQLLKQWHNLSTNWTQNIQKNELNLITNKNRLSFLENTDFQKTYEQLYRPYLLKTNSVVFKTISNGFVNNDWTNESLFQFTYNNKLTQLVLDYFVPASNGLEKFYNVQRERKIWWMRYSANPSRYSVEPFNLNAEKQTKIEFSEKCKSITIKSHFPYGAVDMESVTLVPMYKLMSDLNSSFSKDNLKFSLIRSVIQLDLTTCALLLDGREHKRNNTLMLNRKLAPYQVLLACLHQGNQIVNDLSLHLEYIIQRASLRLYDKPIHKNTLLELDLEILNFDSLGIPYILMVTEDTIKTGLIKLRSRDTTLFETIHLSDIPNYLLKIFTN